MAGEHTLTEPRIKGQTMMIHTYTTKLLTVSTKYQQTTPYGF